jgi:hypothetical protein
MVSGQLDVREAKVRENMASALVRMNFYGDDQLEDGVTAKNGHCVTFLRSVSEIPQAISSNECDILLYQMPQSSPIKRENLSDNCKRPFRRGMLMGVPLQR